MGLLSDDYEHYVNALDHLIPDGTLSTQWPLSADGTENDLLPMWKAEDQHVDAFIVMAGDLAYSVLKEVGK